MYEYIYINIYMWLILFCYCTSIFLVYNTILCESMEHAHKLFSAIIKFSQILCGFDFFRTECNTLLVSNMCYKLVMSVPTIYWVTALLYWELLWGLPLGSPGHLQACTLVLHQPILTWYCGLHHTNYIAVGKFGGFSSHLIWLETFSHQYSLLWRMSWGYYSNWKYNYCYW